MNPAQRLIAAPQGLSVHVPLPRGSSALAAPSSRRAKSSARMVPPRWRCLPSQAAMRSASTTCLRCCRAPPPSARTTSCRCSRSKGGHVRRASTQGGHGRAALAQDDRHRGSALPRSRLLIPAARVRRLLEYRVVWPPSRQALAVLSMKHQPRLPRLSLQTWAKGNCTEGVPMHAPFRVHP